MNKLNTFDLTALILTIVGGINWGLIGLFDFDLVASILGQGSVPTKFIYSLVGASAIYLLLAIFSFGRKS